MVKFVSEFGKIIFCQLPLYNKAHQLENFSKIRLLEAFRIGLKLSDPEGIGRNLKIEKAFRF